LETDTERHTGEPAAPPSPFWRRQIRISLPRREFIVALASLTLLVALLLDRAVFRGEAFYERDIQYEWYTEVEMFVRSLAVGSWPLWDTSTAFGQPLLAHPDSEILYPPTWLNLVMAPWTYYSVFVVGHLIFSAFGVYLLARRISCSPRGSYLAAAIWVTSGPLLSLIEVWHHFAGAAWIPWIVLAADRALGSLKLSDALVWGLASGLQILAGSADMCAMTQVICVGWGASRIRWPEPFARNRRLASSALIAWGVALGLSACMWVPTLSAVLNSARAQLPEEIRTAWSVHPILLLQVWLPVPLGDMPLLPRYDLSIFSSGYPFMPSLYLGLASFGLVVLGPLNRQARKKALLIVLFVAATLFALGPHAPLYGLAVKVFPPLRIFRYPSKAMIVPALCWSLLAGLGLDAAFEEREGTRGRLRVLALPILVTVVSGGLLLVPPGFWERFLGADSAGRSTAEALKPALVQVGVATALSAAVLAALLYQFSSRGKARWLAPALTLLAVGDLVFVHHDLNLTVPKEFLTFRPPLADVIRQPDRRRLYVYDYESAAGKAQQYLGRSFAYMIRVPPGMPRKVAQVLAQRLSFFPPVPGRWGLETSYDIDLRGLYPAELSGLVQLLLRVEGTPTHLRLLRMGAVSQVVTLHESGFPGLVLETTLPSYYPEPFRVFRVPNPLPRTYAVGRVREADGGAAFELVQDEGFDPAREVILPKRLALPEDASFQGSSRIEELRPDRVRLQADLNAPGYVVLVDGYDPGWRATIDGREAPVLRANLAFRAVQVPAGRHAIEFVYRPRDVLWGLGATLATLVLTGFLAWRLAEGGSASLGNPSVG
jgi:hypothetical protein